MQQALKFISYLALALTIVPAILFLTETLELKDVKLAMIAGMVLWFTNAIPWLAFRKEEFDTSNQDQI